MYTEKPQRGSNRERRKNNRHFYQVVKDARKAGNFTNVAGMNFTTKAAANLFKYSRQSSRRFVAYYSYVRSEKEFYDLARYADY